MTRILRAAIGLALALTLLDASPAKAEGVYDPEVLDYWQPRYQRSTQRILDEIVLPHMEAAEKRALGRVPPMEFPLRPLGESANHPLGFYAYQGVIYMPIASLKFLDDLCIAYAWLQINGYSLETVAEYTAILRFGDAPPEGFPPPLEALQIPANALDDSRVDDLALGHFVTARTFLVAHELGHVLYRHSASSPAQSRRNEREADRFAFELMGRTPLPPNGALVFFMADAHWSYLEENPDASHPLSGDRVKAAADWVDDATFARQLVELGEMIDDREIRLGFVATGKAGDLAALAPRRSGELPSRRSTGSTSEGASNTFAGIYRGHFTQEPDPALLPVETFLERQGDRVRGQYSFGLGIGRIEGIVAGNRLDFVWSYADSDGRGVLFADDAYSFEGTWGYGQASEGAGIWVGSK